MRWTLTLAALVLMVLPAAAAPAALTNDPPIDKAHPAAMAFVRVPSHGALMNGVLYTAAGTGPHPAVLMLHGFPGFEENLDLVQAMRRAGYSVLTFHYRGAWGSPGAFSFAHAIEDSDAAFAFLRANAAKYHLDPRRIFVAGHSMGGFMAANVVAHQREAAGLIMISAWDIGMDGPKFRDPAFRKSQMADFRDNVIPLAGTSPDKLMDEATAQAAGWDFVAYAPAIGQRPALLISAEDDSQADEHRLAQALGGRATEIHMVTDHPYSDHRIALQTAVLGWLEARRGP